jgi:hypothetical protein
MPCSTRSWRPDSSTPPCSERPRLPANGGSAQLVVDHDLPEKYAGKGARSFFEYRQPGGDGFEGFTGGRIRLEVIRTTATGEPTGWHYHSFAQIGVILSGEAKIELEGVGEVVLPARTGYSFGGLRHNVYDADLDYSLLELYMPAAFDTNPCERPEGATS